MLIFRSIFLPLNLYRRFFLRCIFMPILAFLWQIIVLPLNWKCPDWQVTLWLSRTTRLLPARRSDISLGVFCDDLPSVLPAAAHLSATLSSPFLPLAALALFAFMYFLNVVCKLQTIFETSKRHRHKQRYYKWFGCTKFILIIILMYNLSLSELTCASFSSFSLNASYEMRSPVCFCSQEFKSFSRFVTIGRPGKY